MTLVGALGHRHRAVVDEFGAVAPDATGWELGWWIGADDRWRVPTREAAVRQTLVDGAPVVQTAMRVPGGDALHRVYGVAGDGDPIVVEVENASPAPFVVAFVASGAQSAALDDATVVLDGSPAIVSARPPSRWAAAIGRSTDVEVLSGGAREGAFPPIRDRARRIEATFLHPVPHRATLRIALLGAQPEGLVDIRAYPDAANVARGWHAQLDRGMKVVLPDGSLMDKVHSACARALLTATGSRPNELDVAALEEWGFDAEVMAAWPRLSGRQRRRAARRSTGPASWPEVDAAGRDGGAPLLLALRSLLVHEDDQTVTLLADLPREWRGAPIEVHAAPTRHGSVSFAVRWHGDRPALLWEAPPDVTIRAPGLDATWSSADAAGEALLS